MSTEKLYLVTRTDLSPGQRAVQAAHALRAFVEAHPDVDKEWYQNSNYLAILEVHGEPQLALLLKKARLRGFPASEFREPDRENELTAIALGPPAKAICRGLPLALRCM
jgi:peptidyl-tRNA hydrolase